MLLEKKLIIFVRILPKNKTKLIKQILQIIFLSIFIYIYLVLLKTLPSQLIVKIAFTLIYFWFSIGMNANFVMPLIKLIGEIIE